MRRKDREITDPQRIDEIISDCQCCRLGLCDRGRAYIVPLSFGLVREAGRRVFYFHGAKEGRKLDLIRQTGWAGFEMDTHYKLNESEKPAAIPPASAASSAAEGSPSWRRRRRSGPAWRLSCCKTRPGPVGVLPEMLEAVCVFKLEVEELSCKEHL